MVQSLFGTGETKKSGFFDRLKQAVSSTKAQLVERIEEIVEDKQTVDQTVLDDLEATLLAADLGVKTTQEILARLREQVSRRKLQEPRQLRTALEAEILTVLESAAGPRGASRPAAVPKQPPAGHPEVIFVVGVNGVGKTTTIAKLSHFYMQQNRRPLLCAAARQRGSRCGTGG